MNTNENKTCISVNKARALQTECRRSVILDALQRVKQNTPPTLQADGEYLFKWSKSLWRR